MLVGRKVTTNSLPTLSTVDDSSILALPSTAFLAISTASCWDIGITAPPVNSDRDSLGRSGSVICGFIKFSRTIQRMPARYRTAPRWILNIIVHNPGNIIRRIRRPVGGTRPDAPCQSGVSERHWRMRVKRRDAIDGGPCRRGGGGIVGWPVAQVDSARLIVGKDWSGHGSRVRVSAIAGIELNPETLLSPVI